MCTPVYLLRMRVRIVHHTHYILRKHNPSQASASNRASPMRFSKRLSRHCQNRLYITWMEVFTHHASMREQRGQQHTMSQFFLLCESPSVTHEHTYSLLLCIAKFFRNWESLTWLPHPLCSRYPDPGGNPSIPPRLHPFNGVYTPHHARPSAVGERSAVKWQNRILIEILDLSAFTR